MFRGAQRRRSPPRGRTRVNKHQPICEGERQHWPLADGRGEKAKQVGHPCGRRGAQWPLVWGGGAAPFGPYRAFSVVGVVDVARGDPAVRCGPKRGSHGGGGGGGGTAGGDAATAEAGAAAARWSTDPSIPPGYLVVADGDLLHLRELVVTYEPEPRMAAAGEGRSATAAMSATEIGRAHV